MPKGKTLNKLTVYIPQDKQQLRLGKRLVKLAKKKDRSINYLVVEAIVEYLEREEEK